MAEAMIRILQGSAATQTVLGGLTVHPPFASFIQCIGLCAKNCESLLVVDKVIAIIISLTFLVHPVCRSILTKNMRIGYIT